MSENLRSQLEPDLSPTSQCGSEGSKEASSCSEALQGGGTSLGRARDLCIKSLELRPITEPKSPTQAAPSLRTQ